MVSCICLLDADIRESSVRSSPSSRCIRSGAVASFRILLSLEEDIQADALRKKQDSYGNSEGERSHIPSSIPRPFGIL